MMKRKRRAPVPRKTERRWHILPPLAHGGAALEGLEILEERSDGLGVMLWQLRRDVTLWATTPPKERRGLLPIEAAEAVRRSASQPGIPANLRSPLSVLSNLFSPIGADPYMVTQSCRTLSSWAELQGLGATALAFAISAALVSDQDPDVALDAGRLGVAQHESARAEAWLRRAVGLARRAGDWAVYARAHLLLAQVYRARGEWDAAIGLAKRSRSAAARRGHRVAEAEALHEMVRGAIGAGNHPRLKDWIRAATLRYPEDHPGQAELAQDLAALSPAQKRPGGA